MEFSTRRLYAAGRMARRLGVTVRWLRGEAEAGHIPHVAADRTMLFDPETVEQVLLERARRTPASAGGGR